jgi:hypothetical protein
MTISIRNVGRRLLMEGLWSSACGIGAQNRGIANEKAGGL